MGAGKDGKKRVVIIGAGIGGVSTAARLAKAGLEVIVVEKVRDESTFEQWLCPAQGTDLDLNLKNDYHGGRCSLLYSKDADGKSFR
jgi:phytoene desaturase (3,4-didehydrolycopene-forming)